jgi:hypothetical protein
LSIFDFNYWEGCWRGVYFVGVGATVILMVLAGILSARDYPALPMAIFMCGIPLYFWIIQKLVLSPPSLSNKELREDLAEEQAAEDAVAKAEKRASRMVASVELRQEKAYDQYVATFVLSLGYALVATGLICGGIWVGWVVTGNPWNTEIEEEYELRMRCEEILQEQLEEGAEDPDCLAAYLLWFSPFLAALVFCVLGIVC